jgi:hypothetical protein
MLVYFNTALSPCWMFEQSEEKVVAERDSKQARLADFALTPACPHRGISLLSAHTAKGYLRTYYEDADGPWRGVGVAHSPSARYHP